MKRRSIAMLVLAILMITVFAIPAYALTIPNINWSQVYGGSFIVRSSERQTSNGKLIYDGVATSPTEGTFQIALQKRTAGLWFTENKATVFTVKQHSKSTYHTRLGKTVQGQYFRVTWQGLDTNSYYRVIFLNPTAPQQTDFTESRFDIQ